MRIAILYSAVPDNATLEDQDTLVQVETVAKSMARLGHEALAFPCTLDLAAIRNELQRWRPDVIFNLIESLADDDSLVYLPLAVLDVMRLPYTGGRTEALFLTTHKLMAKQRLRSAGLPTPNWIESKEPTREGHEEGDCPDFCVSKNGTVPLDVQSSCSSWIIKGVWDQASRGMDDDAVLRNVSRDEVRKRLAERIGQTGRPCFAEQFVEGREFNISVLAGPDGPEVLRPAEIDFSAFPPGKPRIVGHRAKWQADSFEFNNTPRRFDYDPTDQALLDQLRFLCKACWDLFELRGWVRVDFRVDAAGQPWILEINANPCLSPDAGFAAALEQAGIPFDIAMQRILEDSLIQFSDNVGWDKLAQSHQKT